MNNYAGFGARLVAFFIDNIIINILSSYFYFYTDFWYVSGFVYILYFTIMEGSSIQATAGKKLMGIIVVKNGGAPIGYGTALVRSLCKIISSAMFLIGYIMAAFSENNQALHDKIADTFVIKAGSQFPASNSINNASPSFGQPRIIGLSGEFAGKSFPVSLNGIMLGRDSVACQIVFSMQAKGISRHHCIIKFVPSTSMFVINDIGSSCGTFCNNLRLTNNQAVALKAGERFFLGSPENTFETSL